jgi:PAS domain S-box-containing protein
MLEVLVAALLLYRVISPAPDLTRSKQLASLLLYGVILAPALALASTLVSFCITGHYAVPNLQSFQRWFTADALGIAIVTPLYLSFHRRRQFADRSPLEVAALFALLGADTAVVFAVKQYPLLFLILPCLLFLGMRLRLAGSGMGLLLVAIIGGVFTSHGYGPLFLIPNMTNAGRAFLLQFFIASTMLALYVVELMLSESNRLQLHLQASETRFRILAEASRDIIVLTDLSGTRRYVSPAVFELLGWRPEELLGETYHQVVHPDDLSDLESLFQECRSGRRSNTFSYRCRRKDGAYLWMEANIRLYNDATTGEPLGFVNVVRDISSRKAAEEELHHAFHLFENLASIDGLTGLANRRRLDETLDAEWRRAIREHTPSRCWSSMWTTLNSTTTSTATCRAMPASARSRSAPAPSFTARPISSRATAERSSSPSCQTPTASVPWHLPNSFAPRSSDWI